MYVLEVPALKAAKEVGVNRHTVERIYTHIRREIVRFSDSSGGKRARELLERGANLRTEIFGAKPKSHPGPGGFATLSPAKILRIGEQFSKVITKVSPPTKALAEFRDVVTFMPRSEFLRYFDPRIQDGPVQQFDKGTESIVYWDTETIRRFNRVDVTLRIGS